MAEAERTEMAAGSNGLFSVDSDAHLQKLAASMFPTPAQLPVELVRAALKRKATTVAVEIRRSRLAFTDDGEAIAAGTWHELACALDGGSRPTDRERAIAALQATAAPGIGLLAVLLPGATTIHVESPGRDNRPAMRVTSGRVDGSVPAAGTWGTRIVIRRRGGPVTSETKLLRELCAAAPGAITLNGRKIAGQPVLRRTLVQQSVEVGSERGAAMVAIPARGDICRIWLLDQGIPWQVWTSASWHGLVFDAALESAAPATAREFNLLAAAAGRLYQWLAEHYASFPAPYQERIEELIFKKVKAAGDLRLLSAFAPFRLWRSQQRLNLEDVRRKVEAAPLYALPHDGDPARFLGSHQEALLLTPRQRDFLLNHAGLALVTPPAAMERQNRLSQLAARLRGGAARLAWRLPRRRLQALDMAVLDDGEVRLCREMELFARIQRHPAPGIEMAVAMISGRGLAPCAGRPGPRGVALFLRRRHPLVRAAVRSVACDRANAELAFTALVPARFLTGGRR
jgi:hypothetical protein